MRRFTAVALVLLLLITLTCCNRQPDDPFADLWKSDDPASRHGNSSPGSASSAAADDPSAEPSEVSDSISIPDSSDDASGDTSPSELSALESPEPGSSEGETSPQESSGQESSKPQTSTPAVSRPDTSKQETSKQETSKQTTSKQESSQPPVSKTESPAPASESPSDSSGVTSGDISGDTSGDTSDEPDPTSQFIVDTFINVDDRITVLLPEGWITRGEGYHLEAYNSGRTQFLTVSASSMGIPLSEDEIYEAMVLECKADYPVSDGYSVAESSVTLNNGIRQPCVTIIKTDGSELYQQRIYLVTGTTMVTITVMVQQNHSADAKKVWKYVEVI